MPRVSLHTLGCRLNYAETSTIGKQFIDRGFQLVGFGQEADVCVINTCSVTERAERECRQVIRRALRTSPNPLVVVTGCYAQLEPEEVASIAGVDFVLGTKEKSDLFKYILSLSKSSCPQVFVSDIGTMDSFGPASSTLTGDRTRAFLKIQDGCDYNCSFCTIPLARGESRSQSIDACVAQARALVSDGFKEIVLTGVNVGDYGAKTGMSLLSLLRRLVEIEELVRLRLSSIEPNLLTEPIIEFVAGTEKMCKHFHIPLQSGSDEILRTMRRRYSSAQFAALIHRVKGRIPGCGIGVDVIVGFPGETDRHFETTYLFLADLPVSYFHAFTYSERPNTPAARFGNIVEPKVRFERNAKLRNLSQKKKAAFAAGVVGKIVPVLAEGDVEGAIRYGFTDNYVRVAFSAAETKENTIVPLEITGVDGIVCTGRTLGMQVLA